MCTTNELKPKIIKNSFPAATMLMDVFRILFPPYKNERSFYSNSSPPITIQLVSVSERTGHQIQSVSQKRRKLGNETETLVVETIRPDQMANWPCWLLKQKRHESLPDPHGLAYPQG
ncbi:hypothetical protein ABZP36_005775 [Zizania latifolia]